jgi:hypothetical protein
MGIREVPWMAPLEFIRTVKKSVITEVADPAETKFLNQLAGAGIELDAQMHGYQQDDPLKLRGRVVLAYKYRQGLDTGSSRGVNLENGTSSYEFHLFYCTTFKISRSLYGYVAARRSDGRLEVVPQEHRADLPSVSVQMQLCGNCRKLLVLGSKYFEPFSFAAHVDRDDPYTPKLRKEEEIQSAQERYTPEHDEARDAYGRAVGWRCMSCDLDCTSHGDLLDAYKVTTEDPEKRGIRVLCVACRANESGQGSIRTTRKDDIARARALRRASGDGALASTTGAQ